MVEVKMSGAEYVTLVEAKRELEQLKQAVLDSFEIEASADGVRVRRGWFLSKELKAVLAKKVVEAVKNNQDTIRAVYEKDEYVMDLHYGWLTSRWGALEEPQFDLRDDAELAKQWQMLYEEDHKEEELD